MTSAQSTISAMLAPAFLILGSGTLIATALVRLGRVVDRSRALIAGIDATPPAERERLDATLARHAARARYAERAVTLFFCAVFVFVIDCLSIGVAQLLGPSFDWLPVGLAIAGMFVMISGTAYMLAESRLAGLQIAEEIASGRSRLATPSAPR